MKGNNVETRQETTLTLIIRFRSIMHWYCLRFAQQGSRGAITSCWMLEGESSDRSRINPQLSKPSSNFCILRFWPAQNTRNKNSISSEKFGALVGEQCLIRIISK